jgi:mono-ADP-ribosyltransferase sirtuin 6
MAFLSHGAIFDKKNLAPAETVVRSLPCVQTGLEENGLNCLGGHIEPEKKEELEQTKNHAKNFAKLLRKAKHAVIYTGAGVSTATGVPDYRGPNGAWTCLATGRIPDESVNIESVKPSYAHMCIQKLVEGGLVQFVTSTNLDGLHWKSGLKPHDNLAELHGNIFCMRCPRCKAEFYGNERIVRTSTSSRFQEKWCTCGGHLMDSGIDFGQTLPLQHLALAEKHAKQADLSLVVGTSMRVAPASQLPTTNENGKLCIINLMDTPFDEQATLRSFSHCDDFFFYVMEELKLEVSFPPEPMPEPFNTYND